MRQYWVRFGLIEQKLSGSQDLDLLVSAVEELMGVRLQTEALMPQTPNRKWNQIFTNLKYCIYLYCVH